MLELASYPDVTLPDVNYTAEYTGEGVTREVFSTLPSNAVIVWIGHGGYERLIRNFLFLGEYWDWTTWHLNPFYFDDSLVDNIIRRNTKYQKDLVCVTWKFVRNKCGDMSNDVFLMSSCHSLQVNTFADELRSKGVEVVLGFTQTVYAYYSHGIIADALIMMGSINPDTHELYTIQEALDRVKSDYGDNDIEWARTAMTGIELKEEIAEPRLIGNGSYRLSATYQMDVIVKDAQTEELITQAELTIPTGYEEETYKPELLTREDGQQVIVTTDMETEIVNGSYEIYNSMPRVYLSGNDNAAEKINNSEAFASSRNEGEQNAADIKEICRNGIYFEY